LIAAMLEREHVRLAPGQIANLLNDPGECVHWDDTADPPTVCRVNVNAEEKHVRVVWLLPFGVPAARLLPVLKAAFLDAAARYPESLDYVGEAFFPTRRQGLAWQAYFRSLTVEPHGIQWKITLPSFREAIEVVNRWR